MVNLYSYQGKHFDKLDVTTTVTQLGSRNAKMLGLVKMFDIDSNIYDKNAFKSVSLSSINKFFTLDKFFLLQRGGDFAMQNAILGGMLKKYTFDGTHIRIKKEGEKSLFEQTTIDKAGNFKLPENISDTELFSFKEKVRGIISTIIGNTSDFDKTRAGNTLLGQSLLMYRRWMLPLGTARFGNLKYNESLEDFQMGKYRATGSLIVNAFKERRLKELGKAIFTLKEGSFKSILAKKYADALEINPKLGSFEDFERLYINNLRSTISELMIVGSLALLHSFLDDEDDDVSKVGKRLLARTIAESSFWINPTNFEKIIQSPLPLINHLSQFLGLFKNIAMVGFSDEVEAKDVYKSMRKNLPFFSAYESFLSTINSKD
jgi:hypothetical protein